MFSKGTVTGMIVLGVASALAAGFIVSIGDVQAAPAATSRPPVPAPTAHATTGVRMPTQNSGAAAEVPDRDPRPLDSEGTPPPPVDDAFASLTPPDFGEHCAASLDAHDISAFFSLPIGDFQGADYQRALRLPDDRVLWTF